MKRIVYLGVLMLMSTQINAQQVYQFTQYQLNDYLLNPAIAGSRQYFDGKATSRSQWTGVTDAPRTFAVSLNGPVYRDKMGIGAYLFSDVTGPTRRTGFQASYAYHLTLKEGLKLSFGVSFGLLQFAVDGSKITTDRPEDFALSSGFMSSLRPDANAGFYLYHKKYYFGVSAPQLIGGKLKFFEDDNDPDSELEEHFFATGGYRFTITDDFTVEPTALVRYLPGTPVLFDPGARVIYKDRLWLGGTFRVDTETNPAAAGIYAGYLLQNYLTIGYSYDLPLSNIAKQGDGAHEIVLGIRFKKGRTVEPAPEVD